MSRLPGCVTCEQLGIDIFLYFSRYIMCRAIREKLKAAGHSSVNRPSTFSMSQSLKKVSC